MGSPPQPPTPSSFSPFGASVTLLVAAPPGRDGSTADSFPFDDNRDEKQKEGVLEIIKISDVVSEKAARHDETCLAQVADEEEGSADNFVTLLRQIRDFLSEFTRAPGGSSAAVYNRKLIPKRYKEYFAAAFTKERVEICPTRWLAPFASSPTNPGGVAESETSLLLDSGASFHAVGDVSLLTDPVLFPTDMRAVLKGRAQEGRSEHNHLDLILDSGASMHATGNLRLLSEFTRAPGGSSAAGYHTRDGKDLHIAGVGMIACDKFHLPHVHYVPELGSRFTLASVQLLAGCDYIVMFCGGWCYVKNRNNGSLVGRGRMHDEDGLYHLEYLRIPLVVVDEAN